MDYMMERKLASVQKVRDILPIEGADAIEAAVINDWKVVVKKNEFKVGDLVAYFEIDSFLPIEPEFEFLRKSSYKRLADGSEGFRLRTIKLRGQVSQGLVIPLADAERIMIKNETKEDTPFEVGEDITSALGVVKYDPPVPAQLAGKAKGYFPSFIKKTDEERVQNLTDYYQDWRSSGVSFYATEKLDGSSSTYYFRDGVFGACSRNLELVRPEEPFVPELVMCEDGKERMTQENSFWKVFRELGLEEKLATLGKNVSFQGELIGEGIQKNPYLIKGQTVRFFNIFDIDAQEYYGFYDFMETMSKLGLETVPVLAENFILPEKISDLISYADGKSVLNPNTNREGVVIRSHDRTISFKAISNEFLLKEK